MTEIDAAQFNKLLKKCRTDEIAFTKLYKYYYPKIVDRIHKKFRNYDLGKDVAQEFFVKQLRKEIRDYIDFPTAWVYIVCDNIAKDFLADEKNYNLAFVQEESTPSDSLFERVLYGEYLKQFEKLDEKTRKIFDMHICEGYTLREVADKLKANYNTVRQKYSRGLKRFRKI